MIISRRKYEQDIAEAVRKESEQIYARQYQREDMQRLQDQINALKQRVDKLDPDSADSNCPCVRPIR